ncbi:MAG: hypothetical protein LBB45_00015 [Methanobrevibacter sp.]|jgi:hypothetical protein|nr:hypothetical protein [Candidatus Methanovirga basalitermitum]
MKNIKAKIEIDRKSKEIDEKIKNYCDELGIEAPINKTIGRLNNQQNIFALNLS